MNKKDKLLKEISIDLEEIDYIKRNYPIEDLSIEEIKEIYKNTSNIWLIIQKVVEV